MCLTSISAGMGNFGNRNVKRGWQRAMFNMIDPTGAVSNTAGGIEYMAKGRKENYNSNIMQNKLTNPGNRAKDGLATQSLYGQL